MTGKFTKRMGILWMTLLFVLALSTPIVAYAHASLVTTTPHEGDIVQTTPKQLKLEFNEPLEPDLIDVALYDWNQNQVAVPKPQVTKGKPTEIYTTLPALPNGTYTVAWSVVSEDGHPVRGSYVFSIGVVTEGFVLKSIQDPTAQRLGNLLIALRYIVEGVALLGGGLYWLALRATRAGLPGFADTTGRLRIWGWALLFLGSLGEWFTYSATLPGKGLTASVLASNWGLLGQSPFAQMVVVQLGLLLLMAIPRMVSGWYAMLWVLLVAAFAFGGHAWGIEPVWLALTVRALHLLTISMWLGALSYLALTFSYQTRTGQEIDRTAFRPFFVRSVAIAAGMVAMTGVAMVTIQSDWTKLLGNLLWGKLLVVKIVMMMIMLLLALAQTMRWQKGDKLLSFDFLRVELLIGVLVVQAAVWMSQSPYPVPIKSYHQILQTKTVKNTAEVTIPQLQLSTQVLDVKLTGPEPQKVNVLLEMEDMAMGVATLPAKKLSASHYQVQIPFTMTGHWKFTVDAEYKDLSHVQWSDTILIPKQGA
ncbi:MAG: copper resistance CopC/CopD family protein [Tumebacillaceae bacterium]